MMSIFLTGHFLVVIVVVYYSVCSQCCQVANLQSLEPFIDLFNFTSITYYSVNLFINPNKKSQSIITKFYIL